MKTCKHCKRSLPLSEFSLVRPDKKWRCGRCADCFKIKNSVYNAATADHRHARDKENLPKILAWRKADRAAHPEKYLVAEAKRRAKDHEKLLTYQRDYQVSHRDEFHEYGKKSYGKHREKTLARQKARIQANPEIAHAYCAKRRARKSGAAINDFTAAQWRTLQILYNHCCAYCGIRAKGHITQDHVLALSKGGDHTWDNVVPACKTCNLSKFTGPPPVPVKRFPKPVDNTTAGQLAFF